MEPSIHRPPNIPCPGCGLSISADMPAGGYAPEGFESMYDHYWCRECDVYVDFEDVEVAR